MSVMDKTNVILGMEVNSHLLKLGKETPLLQGMGVHEGSNDLNQAKRDAIEEAFTKIMEALDLDLKDDSLCDTPKRVAKMYVDEVFYGLDYNNFPKCTTVENKMGVDEVVCERGIGVKSFCEHHFLPIDGSACIAYIPKEKILGLSKLNRIANFFSRRPQVQERLTEQIAHALAYILETDDVAVVLNAGHSCVKMRGIEDVNTDTVTSKLLGRFKNNSDLRQEFLSMAFNKGK